MHTRITRVLMLGAALLSAGACSGMPSAPVAPPGDDPHVTAVGFFDMHVCNWPERPLFFKSLYSSVHYEQLRDIQVFSPDGEPLVRFNLAQYKVINKPGMPVKRVYLVDVPVPVGAKDGWYTAHIRTADGRTHLAMDRIAIRQMEQAIENVTPVKDSEHATPPRELSWAPVAGAHHYRVFVHDRWDGDRLIYESPPLTEPGLVFPPGIIKPGGEYLWRVNTRDRHEDPEFGDFNHGSLTPFHAFSVQNPS